MIHLKPLLSFQDALDKACGSVCVHPMPILASGLKIKIGEFRTPRETFDVIWICSSLGYEIWITTETEAGPFSGMVKERDVERLILLRDAAHGIGSGVVKNSSPLPCRTARRLGGHP